MLANKKKKKRSHADLILSVSSSQSAILVHQPADLRRRSGPLSDPASLSRLGAGDSWLPAARALRWRRSLELRAGQGALQGPPARLDRQQKARQPGRHRHERVHDDRGERGPVDEHLSATGARGGVRHIAGRRGS